VPADPGTEEPSTPIAVSNIAIRRVGAEAEAFDIQAWSLPMPTQSVATLQVANSTNASLNYVVPSQAEYFIVHTTNLLNTTRSIDSSGFNASSSPTTITNAFVSVPFGPVHFFYAAQVHYPVFSAVNPGSSYYFAAEWSSGDTYHYFLNITAATGTWAVVPAGTNVVTDSGRLNDVRWRTTTANSTQIYFWDLLGNDFYYTLGFDTPGANVGRFYLDVTSWFGDYLGFERGDFEVGISPRSVTSRDRLARTSSREPSPPLAGRRFRTFDWPTKSGGDRVPAMPEPGIRSVPTLHPQ